MKPKLKTYIIKSNPANPYAEYLKVATNLLSSNSDYQKLFTIVYKVLAVDKKVFLHNKKNFEVFYEGARTGMVCMLRMMDNNKLTLRFEKRGKK